MQNGEDPIDMVSNKSNLLHKTIVRREVVDIAVWFEKSSFVEDWVTLLAGIFLKTSARYPSLQILIIFGYSCSCTLSVALCHDGLGLFAS